MTLLDRLKSPSESFRYPVLLAELHRIEKLTRQEVGIDLVFSDGTAGQILWNLRGMRAGLFSVRCAPKRDTQMSLRFNEAIIKEVGEEQFRPTVAHEYAHAVVFTLRKFSTGRLLVNDIRPHGKIWQNLMSLYGHPPNRCHDYPTSSMRLRKMFRYRCTVCHREFHLGQIRHERLLKNPGYLVCGGCRGVLRHDVESLKS